MEFPRLDNLELNFSGENDPEYEPLIYSPRYHQLAVKYRNFCRDNNEIIIKKLNDEFIGWRKQKQMRIIGAIPKGANEQLFNAVLDIVKISKIKFCAEKIEERHLIEDKLTVANLRSMRNQIINEGRPNVFIAEVANAPEESLAYFLLAAAVLEPKGHAIVRVPDKLYTAVLSAGLFGAKLFSRVSIIGNYLMCIRLNFQLEQRDNFDKYINEAIKKYNLGDNAAPLVMAKCISSALDALIHMNERTD